MKRKGPIIAIVLALTMGSPQLWTLANYTVAKAASSVQAPIQLTRVGRTNRVAATARSKDGLWQKISPRSVVMRLMDLGNVKPLRPDSYETFALNNQAFKSLLQRAFRKPAPSARRPAGQAEPIGAPSQLPSAVISVPMPGDSYQRFRIAESEVLAPGLAARYPDIQTFTGQGADQNNSSDTIHLQYSPSGLHAMVLTAGEAYYVDPLKKGDNQTHIAYFARQLGQDTPPLRCFVNNTNAQSRPLSDVGSTRDFTYQGGLRTYRLAVAATAEYTQFQGGTVAKALEAISWTVQRVSGIYQKELGIAMTLIEQEDSVIYTNPSNEPYTNNNPSSLLTQNQANLDRKIGSANYDIGHVVGTGGGGLAQVGCVCADGVKAMGETGGPKPTGDAFDVDYVAHEVGHQFGANHTFNATVGACAGGTRNGPTAFEPGSGSTIMAYAGICGSEDLQPHSDPYFHSASLYEIASYINTIGNGPQPAPNPSPAPNINAGPDRVIPIKTPFTLTATVNPIPGGSASYCWEELDLGDAAPPDTDDNGTARPIFRSILPSTGLSRVFTNQASSVTIGDSLPTIGRTMNFRITARSGTTGGAFKFGTVQVTVSAASGPFAITLPANSTTWVAGSKQTVTWDIANTDASPVSCAKVDISLSTDGGQSFPLELASNVANNGSFEVTVPNVSSNNARVKISAADNIFFAISASDLSIVGAQAQAHGREPRGRN